MADLTGMLQAAAGVGGAEGAYIEDVFSTYLYTGNGSTQTITNGIDLDGEGGLVWIKHRSSGTRWHILVDSVRGFTGGEGYILSTNATNAQFLGGGGVTSFENSGFNIDSLVEVNQSSNPFVSWTFRKAPKFFDVVTYTGTGSARTVAHNLGSVPGCIIVKRTDTTGDWQVYHRANTASPETDYLVLNSTAATADSNTRWNDTLPTDSVFTVGTEATVNASGGTYVAYLFAHDAGGFGDDGEQNVISCGSYTGNASSNGPEINLGYEPQWLLIKNTTNASSRWVLLDNMRGITGSTGTQILEPHTSNAEFSDAIVRLTATGFKIVNGDTNVNGSGATIVYVAIRRGPMKTPTSGTEVFGPTVYTGTNADNRLVNTSLLTDMVMIKERNDTGPLSVADRLRGDPYLVTSSTAAEVADADSYMTPTSGVGNAFSAMNGVGVGNDATSKVNIDTTSNNHISFAFKRAPGFFDVVCYTGTGVARTVDHNLGVAPELLIVKSRSNTEQWWTYSSSLGATKALRLQSNAAESTASIYWNDTSPTVSVFTVGAYDGVNGSAFTYVAYLFASLPGVSKVGSYTGTGTTLAIDCGFSAGARFVMVKATSTTGDWIVVDTARGLIAGNDPTLALNSTAAEVTTNDWFDPYSAGFELSSAAGNLANTNAVSYIFLAIS